MCLFCFQYWCLLVVVVVVVVVVFDLLAFFAFFLLLTLSLFASRLFLALFLLARLAVQRFAVSLKKRRCFRLFAFFFLNNSIIILLNTEH